jgi:hypothetical protein
MRVEGRQLFLSLHESLTAPVHKKPSSKVLSSRTSNAGLNDLFGNRTGRLRLFGCFNSPSLKSFIQSSLVLVDRHWEVGLVVWRQPLNSYGHGAYCSKSCAAVVFLDVEANSPLSRQAECIRASLLVTQGLLLPGELNI